MAGAGSLWAPWLWSGVYPADAPHGFAGRRWRVSNAIKTFGDEIDVHAKAMGYERWCLGTRGDSRHIEEWLYSEHNANVLAPDGMFLVLAIDVIEEVTVGLDLDGLFAALYEARDPRVYRTGYIHHNSQITTWGGKGETHYNAGDDGHGHISQAQGAYPGGRGGYLPAMDSTASWFAGHITSGGHAVPIAPQEDDDMALKDDKTSQALIGQIVHDKIVEVLRAPEFDLERLNRRADDLEQANKAMGPVIGLAKQIVAAQHVSAADVAAALLPGLTSAVAESGSGATAEQIADLIAQRLAG